VLQRTKHMLGHSILISFSETVTGTTAPELPEKGSL